MKHLHRDYHTSHCGLDASHIPMTFDAGATECADCLAALEAFEAQQETDRLERERTGALLKEAAEAKAALSRKKADEVALNRAVAAAGRARAAAELNDRLQRIETALGLRGQ